MTKKVQWSYTSCPVLWVLSGLWLVGWASRGSLAVTGSQVTDALLTRFSMFAVHSLITRGIVSQWGHRQRARRSRNNRLLGLLYSPMRPFVFSRPRNVFFALFVCAIFSVHFTQIYYHITKELCAWLTHATLFTHIAAWYISVKLRKMQTYFGKIKISSYFPLKLSIFVIFYEK